VNRSVVWVSWCPGTARAHRVGIGVSRRLRRRRRHAARVAGGVKCLDGRLRPAATWQTRTTGCAWVSATARATVNTRRSCPARQRCTSETNGRRPARRSAATTVALRVRRQHRPAVGQQHLQPGRFGSGTDWVAQPKQALRTANRHPCGSEFTESAVQPPVGRRSTDPGRAGRHLRHETEEGLGLSNGLAVEAIPEVGLRAAMATRSTYTRRPRRRFSKTLPFPDRREIPDTCG